MTPRTPKQFKDLRHEKKTLIMNVALEHFASEGYHNSSISQIAKQAGISKGLIYNYFSGKEDLLAEIVNRSMEQFSKHFSPENNGPLSEEDFELFVRKYFLILREELSFWRLYFQLVIQKDVREHLLKPYQSPVNSVASIYANGSNTILAFASRMLTDYFISKKAGKPDGYDPILEMNMFIYTIEGFARSTAYLDEIDENYFEKTVNRIIELYK
jgi:AcrR family transcriptional regulator